MWLKTRCRKGEWRFLAIIKWFDPVTGIHIIDGDSRQEELSLSCFSLPVASSSPDYQVVSHLDNANLRCWQCYSINEIFSRLSHIRLDTPPHKSIRYQTTLFVWHCSSLRNTYNQRQQAVENVFDKYNLTLFIPLFLVAVPHRKK